MIRENTRDVHRAELALTAPRVRSLLTLEPPRSLDLALCMSRAKGNCCLASESWALMVLSMITIWAFLAFGRLSKQHASDFFC